MSAGRRVAVGTVAAVARRGISGAELELADRVVPLAGVWDGTTKALYVDGVRALSIPGTPVVFDAHDIVIGGDLNVGTPAFLWEGRLDELRLYDRGLTQAEIAILAAP